jgi:hypothetical protein
MESLLQATQSQETTAPSSTKKVKSKAQIREEVKILHTRRISTSTDADLKQLHQSTQTQLNTAKADLESAQEAHRVIDEQKNITRDACRADKANKHLREAWHTLVKQVSELYTILVTKRELFQHAEALMALVEKEMKRRSILNDDDDGRDNALDTEGGGGPSVSGGDTLTTNNTMRRKRKAPPGTVPLESCPYCLHTYTVRDGFSNKKDTDGNRLHHRKCHCRAKTPPCKNCPVCRLNTAIMDAKTADAQKELCLSSNCHICACNCPAMGKWVETDPSSRQAFRDRTTRRHAELAAHGWTGSIGGGGESPAPSAAGTTMTTGAKPTSSKGLGRLPADIRKQLETHQYGGTTSLGGEGGGGGGGNHHHHKCDHPHEDCTSECCSAPHSLHHDHHPLATGNKNGGGIIGHHNHNHNHQHQHRGGGGGSTMLVSLEEEGEEPDLGAMMQAMSGKNVVPMGPLTGGTGTNATNNTLRHPAPELPGEIVELAEQVFEHAAGMEGVEAVVAFLKGQRLTSLGDFKFMELEWLVEELQPQGLTPLLLNKFLQLGRERGARNE